MFPKTAYCHFLSPKNLDISFSVFYYELRLDFFVFENYTGQCLYPSCSQYSLTEIFSLSLFLVSWKDEVYGSLFPILFFVEHVYLKLQRF